MRHHHLPWIAAVITAAGCAAHGTGRPPHTAALQPAEAQPNELVAGQAAYDPNAPVAGDTQGASTQGWATRLPAPAITRGHYVPGAPSFTSWGNPPGAYTAPGTGRAIRPQQGTSTNGGTPPSVANTEPNHLRETMALQAEVAAAREESLQEVRVTERIRGALLDDDTLSHPAKDVAIIAGKSEITLRGLARNDQERAEIERIAHSFAGTRQVKDEVELTSAAPRMTY